MKKKIYILAVTFLCLLCSQLSYGFAGEGDYGNDDDYNWGYNTDLDCYIEDLRNLLGDDRVIVYDDSNIYLFIENHVNDLHYETETIYENDIDLWMQGASELEKSLVESHDYIDANGTSFIFYTVPIEGTITYNPTFNIDGYDNDGYDNDGFDPFGYDRDGFNQNGYNADGYNREGYDLTGYDQNGFDPNGYDNLGYDWFGYDSNGFDSRGNEASDYDSNGYDDTGYDQTGHDADGYSDPNAPENYKRRWFVDKDNDNYSSEVVYFDAFELKNYPYKLTVFGPDCDDNNKLVTKLNKCGKCEPEPANGSCSDIPCDKKISKSLLIIEANKLGLKIEHILAVYKIETKGQAFRDNGDPVVLFERHYFSRFTNHIYDNSYPEISNPIKGGYGLYNDQLRKLKEAVALNETAGIKSASYGGFQIMGSNYQAAGFDSLKNFYNAMTSTDVNLHLLAFISYIKYNGLVEKLKNEDWYGFAKSFNGKYFDSPGSFSQNYDKKMAEEFKKLIENPALTNKDCL